MDWYTCVQSLSILAAIEVCTALWIFGAGNLRFLYLFQSQILTVLSRSERVRKATGKSVPAVFVFLWWSVTPVLVLVIMVFSIIGYTPITYGEYEVSW